MPGSPRPSRPLVLAHRGARQVAPENTLEAFTRALSMGADGVELDVHRTLDDGLVVHHDAEASGVGLLAARALADVQAARPDIPTLEASLDACAGALVNIEIKNLPGDSDYDEEERVAELVVEELRRRGGGDRVLVSSFNLPSIDRVRDLDAGVPTAFLTTRGFDPLDALGVCADRGHGAYHPFVGALDGAAAATVSDRAHELGLRVNVWTVNDAPAMRRLAGAGVDGIVTDAPDLAVDVLAGGD